MKKKLILTLILFIGLLTVCSSKACYAKTKQFWLEGYGADNANNREEYRKRIIINYNGYKVTVKGYAWKAETLNQLQKTNEDRSKVIKLKKKTYIVSKKCKVCLGGGAPVISYNKFLKQCGKKGHFDFYPYIRLRNGKVDRLNVGN